MRKWSAIFHSTGDAWVPVSPWFTRSTTKRFLFYFSARRGARCVLLQKQVNQVYWSCCGDREAGPLFSTYSHQTGRKLSRHPSTNNQTTISKPNKWVALATKAKLVLLYAGRHVRTHTGTKNIVYRRDTKVQILYHASLGQKCVTFEKGERNKLVFFCKGRTASCRFRSPSLSHAAHVTWAATDSSTSKTMSTIECGKDGAFISWEAHAPSTARSPSSSGRPRAR